MFRLTIKELAAKKMRLFSTALAVILGVAFLAGTLILTATVTKTFDHILADANAGTDAYVRGNSPLSLSFGEQRPRLDGTIIDEVRSAPGVSEAALRINGYAQIVDKHGKPIGDATKAPALGSNWMTVETLNPYRLSAGHAPLADDEIVIDKHAADTAGYVPGDKATVLTTGAPRTFTIAGIVKFGTADSAGGATSVLFNDTTAQLMLAQPGQIDGVAVTADDGVSQETLAANVAAVVGDRAQVITGDQLTAEDQQALHEGITAFSVFMLVFAGIAMFVGAFIINNTFSIIVTQRSREMAMLRAMGASRRQVMRAVLLEALVIGTVASAAGLVAGIGVASGLKMMLSSVGLDIPAGPPVIETSTIVISMTVGVLVTLLSAVLPARRGSKVPPIAALRDVAVDRSAGSKRRAVMGVALTALGVAAVLGGLSGGALALVGLGALVVIVGVSVLGPVLARPVSAVLGYPLAKLRGTSGVLAQQNAMRSPRRTARTASSLMIGVGLVAFIMIFAASAKTSMAGSMEKDYHGTHIVDSGAFDSSAGFSPELAATLHTTNGVRLVSEQRVTKAELNGSATDMLMAFEPATIGQLFDLGTITGSLDQLGSDGMAVEAKEATARGWALGDTVTVTFPNGTKPFTVKAIYDNGIEWVGPEFVGIDGFAGNIPTALDAKVYVATDDPAALEAAAADYPSAKVLDKQGFLAEKNAQMDMMLKLMYAMLTLAVLIALLGIANTLALSIYERKRELGLLRAVGMSRAQVRSSVRWESVIIALFGTALGLGIGVFFGWAMVGALSDQGIDTLTIPASGLLVVTLGGAFAGVAAAIVPARRAARLDVLKAVATG